MSQEEILVIERDSTEGIEEDPLMNKTEKDSHQEAEEDLELEVDMK